VEVEEEKRKAGGQQDNKENEKKDLTECDKFETSSPLVDGLKCGKQHGQEIGVNIRADRKISQPNQSEIVECLTGIRNKPGEIVGGMEWNGMERKVGIKGMEGNSE
jgi:hypothetical protein